MEESLWWATYAMWHLVIYTCSRPVMGSDCIRAVISWSVCKLQSAILPVNVKPCWGCFGELSLQLNIVKKTIFQIANPKGLRGAKLLSEIMSWRCPKSTLQCVLLTVKCVHNKMYFLQTVCHQVSLTCVEQLYCFCSCCIGIMPGIKAP